jgi:polysaccharide export outer membrane protein
LISSIDNRLSDIGGQSLETTVNPEGTVTLPAVGSVRAHGLTLDELRYELNRRYEEQAHGLEVTPLLQRRAPRYVYVAGEVVQPGRYELVGPTSVNQAIAMAQGRVNGAHLTQVVVYRRGDDWRLKATMINVRPALQGRRACPSDEIWLRDSDIVVVPRSRLRVATDFIDLAFTRGIYSVFPVGFNVQLARVNSSSNTNP